MKIKTFLLVLLALILSACIPANGVDPVRVSALETQVASLEGQTTGLDQDLSDHLATSSSRFTAIEDGLGDLSGKVAGLEIEVQDHDNLLVELANTVSPPRDTVVDVSFAGDPPHQGTFNFNASYFVGNGSFLSIRVHVGSSSAMNEELPVYFVPVEQPSGFVRDLKGTCLIDSEDRPWQVVMVAEWVREPGGLWAVQCKDDVDQADGVVIIPPRLLHKRWPWLARTGDKWFVTIPYQ